MGAVAESSVAIKERFTRTARDRGAVQQWFFCQDWLRVPSSVEHSQITSDIFKARIRASAMNGVRLVV